MSDMFQDFSGSGPFEPLPQPSSTAPALPIEGHIVAAALAAEKMRELCAQMLLIFQHAPRDAALLYRLHREAFDAWAQVDENYAAYRAVLECKGQA